MDKKIKKIFQKQLEIIKPSEQELKNLKEITKKIMLNINKLLRGKAKSFIGGSLAKETIIRKKKYDIDLFVQFNSKFIGKDKKMSSILEKTLKKYFKNAEKVHGSRDYFNVSISNQVILEIVPILFVAKPEKAYNVTDLSFFHVNYVKNQIKRNLKLADEIRLAKSFCFSQNCYGAESYIQGFSGYALEVLICYYKSFYNFLKTASKWSKKKIILDPAKHFKNKNEVMTEINESKLVSPIILIDPTYKERNVCAAVSQKTFDRFISACRGFIKHPNLKFFSQKSHEQEMKEMRAFAKTRKAKIIILIAKSKNEKEDIAASKLLKFFNFLAMQMEKNQFEILRKEVEFLLPEKKAIFYIIYKEPKQILVKGPPVNMKDFAKTFKEKYKKIFIAKNRIFANVKGKDMNYFLKDIRKNLNAMGIDKLAIF